LFNSLNAELAVAFRIVSY